MKSIAILGQGVVGSGVYDVIEKNKQYISDAYNESVEISHILVRNVDKYKDHKNHKIFTNDFETILSSDCNVVIELMGGINPAFGYVESALKARKHVITANKDLIAEHGEYLHEVASKYNVVLNYEASVGGGIPALKTLRENLVGNKVNSVTGILNGTTNFILSKMYNENLDYNEVLKTAQELGFAEADPSSDVLGFDAARKLSILAKLSANKNLKVKDIMIDGIVNVDSKDIETAKQLGYKIKLVSKFISYENDMHAFVKPVYVKASSPMGSIDNEYNTIVVDIEEVGEMTFSGKGAGKVPTASAVFGDLLDIIINDKKHNQRKLETPAISHYVKGDNEWLVRMYSLNGEINLERVFKNFDNANVEIKDFTDANDLAFLVKGISESYLFDTLNILKEEDAIAVSKYFLILK